MGLKTNWESLPGWYMSNDSDLFEVIYCTGTKKGNKYFRHWYEDGPDVEGWNKLMWNCIDTQYHTRYDSLEEIKAKVTDNDILGVL